MVKHKIQNTKYEMLIAKITTSTTLADDTDFKFPETVTAPKSSRELNLMADTSVLRLKVVPSTLQEAWKINRRVSKDDWLEWLRKLSIELLKQSPIPALRSCLSVAQTYYQLPKDLFNVAFVSWWNELEDTMQSDLMASLSLALTSPDIPEITQAILNLAEFMEHCDKGPLPIDPRILGERAMHCRYEEDKKFVHAVIICHLYHFQSLRESFTLQGRRIPSRC